MKQTNHIIYPLLALCALCSCVQRIDNIPQGSNALTIAPSIHDLFTPQARALGGNSFFENGNEIDLYIQGETAPYTYAYNKQTAIFTSAKPYYFQLGDDAISLNAQWPAGRPAAVINDQNEITIQTDQRNINDFRSADWLTVHSQVTGIMPTEAPVPLEFKHENTRLEFDVAGQNAYGQKITELLLALTLKNEVGLGQSVDIATAFWAYCGDESGHAQIILPPHVSINTQVSGSSSMIGRITLSDNTQYTGSILLPPTNVELKPGYSYRITLTPQGDDLVGSIHIGGFGQDEEGVSYPFQLPLLSSDGRYLVSNKAQLNTLSYLTQHYSNDAYNTIEWNKQKYTLDPQLAATIDHDFAAQWIHINNTPEMEIYNAGEPDPIKSILYDNNQELQLYERP